MDSKDTLESHCFSEQVVVVLVRPQHAGNIGAVCRAMKNMGFQNLRLVAPALPDPDKERWMAPGATDILDSTQTFDTLDEALADVHTVLGTTARERYWHYPVSAPRELGALLAPRVQVGARVAILFGQEDFGLDNDALGRCERVICIPTMGHRSLNLSQAVLLILYELMVAAGNDGLQDVRPLAPVKERERVVQRLLQLAERVDYLRGRNPRQVEALFRGLAGRLTLEQQEVGYLLGLSRKIAWHLTRAGVRESHDVDFTTWARGYKDAELERTEEEGAGEER